MYSWVCLHKTVCRHLLPPEMKQPLKGKKKLQQGNIFSSLFILIPHHHPSLNCFPIRTKQVLKHETLPRDFLYKIACFYSLAFKLDMLLTQNVKIKMHLVGRSYATGMSQKVCVAVKRTQKVEKACCHFKKK